MNYEDWVKMCQNPLKINWSEPLTEEELLKLSIHLPKIAKVLQQEQKELRQLKKIADQYEREASAKDSEISKERLKMRLRKKLADKKEAMAKDGLTHLCSEYCERRQKRRAKKLAAKKKDDAAKSSDFECYERRLKKGVRKLAAKKKLDGAKTSDPECFEEQQQTLEGEKGDNLHQYRDPDEIKDDDEKEEKEDSQNGEGEQDNDIEYGGDGFNPDVNTQPQECSSAYEDSDLAEGLQPCHRKEVQQPQKGDTSISISTELDLSDDFSKFLNYEYRF